MRQRSGGTASTSAGGSGSGGGASAAAGILAAAAKRLRGGEKVRQLRCSASCLPPAGATRARAGVLARANGLLGQKVSSGVRPRA